jgi:tetratricopeptide (TPR) repeat protein
VSLEKYPQAPYSYRAAYRIGLLYRDAKEPEQALHWLGKQRELYSDRLHAQRALFGQAAVYYWDLKDYDKAIEVARQYLNEYPDGEHTWISYCLMARSYEDNGNKAQAIAVLQEALERFTGTTFEELIAQELGRIQEGGAK